MLHDLLAGHHVLRSARHHRERVAIVTVIRDLVCDDQMVFRLDDALHVVADDARLLAGRRHRTAVGIRQRDLRFAGRVHAFFDGAQRVGFLLVVRELLDRPHHARLGHDHAGLHQHLVGTIELGQIAGDRLVDLTEASAQLLPRVVARLRVDGLELAAVDRHARLP